MGVKIIGVGAALPERVVGNDEIAERLGVDPSWIEVRTGIRERRVAAPDESAATLGTAAARGALAVGELEPPDVDLVITATVTPDHHFPPTAALIQHALGAGTVPSFDINAACSGFIYALKVGASLAGPETRRVLVIGAEVLSRFTDPQDQEIGRAHV